MAEERRFIRHPSDIPIEFASARLEEKASGEIQNVSLGGLAFEANYCPEDGELLEVRIPGVTPAFEAQGRVAWCRSLDGKYEVGLQFVDASTAFRARMVEQVCHIENYKREVEQHEGRKLSGDTAAKEWISKYGADFPR
jgi:hypothetical protein